MPGVRGISLDRRVHGTWSAPARRSAPRWVREHLGVDGTGVGIAIIDSGVSPWHDDLGASRVIHFADFVNFQPFAYDDYGHGTHVAGIIAGNGHDSETGARRGIAPGAHLVVLKVLDGDRQRLHQQRHRRASTTRSRTARRYNIRVINLSVAAGVYESYTTDPLTLAAKRAVEAGIVVVAAAGNLGRDARRTAAVRRHRRARQRALGAHRRRLERQRHGRSRATTSVAAFSSRGPAPIDEHAKPDLVAPGVGIESTRRAGSTLFAANPAVAPVGHGQDRDASRT